MAMVFISSITRQPLVHFQLWVEKATKEHASARDEAKQAGTTYLGPTPLSTLATAKRFDIRSEMVELMFAEHSVFKPVWDTLPAHLYQCGRQLVVSLILVLIASWDFRFDKVLDDIHFSIMAMLEKRHDEPDDRRKVIARQILETPDDSFDRVPNAMFTDVPMKLKHMYFDSLQIARDTGCCPAPLYVFLLLYRARLPYQNQSVEGHISVMQSIAKRGVRSKLPGVSDRLRNKIGDSISVKEAVELHTEVVQFMKSQEHANRWSPYASPVPQEATKKTEFGL